MHGVKRSAGDDGDRPKGGKRARGRADDKRKNRATEEPDDKFEWGKSEDNVKPEGEVKVNFLPD